jgi:Domain of unknown function (DUF4157)
VGPSARAGQSKQAHELDDALERVEPRSSPATRIGGPLWLQSQVGNRATTEILARRYPAVTVGAADDRAEMEADRLADEALARIGLGDLRRSSEPSASGGSGTIGPEGGVLDDDTSAQLGSRLGQGLPLSADVAHQFGHALDTDLSGVRVHTDGEADRLARHMSATAFTVGTDIFFSSGSFAPDSPGGRHVLAHELAHVRQQRGGA